MSLPLIPSTYPINITIAGVLSLQQNIYRTFSKRSFFILNVHFLQTVQMSTDVQEWSWNTYIEMNKRLSIWKYDSLKRNFCLISKTLDHTADFCRPDWFIQKDCIFKYTPTNFDLHFSPLFFFFLASLWVRCVSSLGSDHINHIVRAKDAWHCAPAGMRTWRRLVYFCLWNQKMACFMLLKLLYYASLNEEGQRVVNCSSWISM